MSNLATAATPPQSTPAKSQNIEEKLVRALERLEVAAPMAKLNFQGPVLELAQRLLVEPDSVPQLYALAPRFDAAGVFYGTDWDTPSTLQPNLVAYTLQHGEPATVTLECLSELRLLAIAQGHGDNPDISAEQARLFLTQVLALNLHRLFHGQHEAERTRLGRLGQSVADLHQYLLAHIGLKDILGSLIDEIWRILAQRPIQVGYVKTMVTQIALSLAHETGEIGEARLGADRLVSALFAPTHGSRGDPGLEEYTTRLNGMDLPGLQQEASGLARAMHDIGLVSDYHAVFLRWLLMNQRRELIADSLGLGSTGIDVLRNHGDLVCRLIEDAIHPETAQAIYGLALLLDRGILHMPPIAPGLWRQIGLRLSAQTVQSLSAAFGEAQPPRAFLLAGVISLLGQPLGIGQGNNPTCQSARALSMWSWNDPDFLLHSIAHAARFDSILMHFEGEPISSSEIMATRTAPLPLDTDPVSVIVVPHLEHIYNEMGKRCAGRGDDPHRWINPELHGWWVGRKFMIAVDVGSGKLKDYDTFIRNFYGSYHPHYNGNQPVIHPQPAGLAVTDSTGAFIGWHAITLLRVVADQHGVMRVYFYNPNNDSGQDWGHDVVVSTHGCGENFGEASLPFPQLLSRLYIYHDDPVEESILASIPATEFDDVKHMAISSWAADRVVTHGEGEIGT